MTQSQKHQRPKLVLVDGHSLAYRAFYALPADMQTTTGELTNAVYGFTSMLMSVLHDEDPQYVIVTFDKGPSFRERVYAEYKAHREKMPEEMHAQMSRIQEIVEALGIPMVAQEDYEADDLLGTLARQAVEENLHVVIVTGDRDALQLVNDEVTVLTSGRRFSDTLRYTPEKVREKYEGLSPAQFVDFKALIGDRSDNIPGVKGVGEKGATQMLNKYGSLDNIYEHLDELSTRYHNALKAGRDEAYLSRKLSRIVCDAPVTLDLASAARWADYDPKQLLDLLHQLEFRSLVDRIPKPPRTQIDGNPGQLQLFKDIASGISVKDLTQRADSPSPLADRYHLITSEEALVALVQTLQDTTVLTVDTETTGIDAMTAELVGISLTHRKGEAWYIPVKAPNGEPVLELATVAKHLGPLLVNPEIVKQGHNLKYDLKILAQLGSHSGPESASGLGMPSKGPYFDTMVAEWLINPASSNLGLKNLAWARLGIQMTEITDLIGTGQSQKTMDEIPLQDVMLYACADADITHRLAEVLKADLEDYPQGIELLQDLEMPLLPILAEMEMTGVKVDMRWLQELSKELDKRLEQLEQRIFRYADTEFNVNSTQQLSEVLFNTLGLSTRGVRKTKTGYYSTRAAVLEKLQGTHPIIDLILELRELSKLKSTYVDALPEMVNPKTGRIHTSYNQTGTVTGRLSSTDPNLQNIPIRTEEGRRVRRAFVAQAGWQLVAADYSQVELRVMAHVSEDEGLISAFARGEDIHSTTAAAVYGVALEDVDYEMRRVAKAVNFGLIYGQSAYGLARQIGVSPQEAKAFITRYFERFPRVQDYMDCIQREVEEQGYVETLLQRRRYFPEFSQSGGVSTRQRQAALRMAINTPIQGTAADILKLAMLRMDRRLKDNDLRARIILQVHDELVLEVPHEEIAIVIPLIREAMEGAFKLKVPLKVDIEIGENWDAMHKKSE
jgi:DNA polymerase-1